MRFTFVILLSIVGLALSACRSQPNARPKAPALRSELLEMRERDQKVREAFSPKMSAEKRAELEAVDARHVARMKEIIRQYGWPGRSVVGDDGAQAAWLLVQHGTSDFMAECLPLLQRAVVNGEVSEQNFAYLLDRVRMNEGKPQVYGTQFTFTPDGKPVTYPIEDVEHVDARRERIGLPPMKVQEKEMLETYR